MEQSAALGADPQPAASASPAQPHLQLRQLCLRVQIPPGRCLRFYEDKELAHCPGSAGRRDEQSLFPQGTRPPPAHPARRARGAWTSWPRSARSSTSTSWTGAARPRTPSRWSNSVNGSSPWRPSAADIDHAIDELRTRSCDSLEKHLGRHPGPTCSRAPPTTTRSCASGLGDLEHGQVAAAPAEITRPGPPSPRLPGAAGSRPSRRHRRRT